MFNYKPYIDMIHIYIYIYIYCFNVVVDFLLKNTVCVFVYMVAVVLSVESKTIFSLYGCFNPKVDGHPKIVKNMTREHIIKYTSVESKPIFFINDMDGWTRHLKQQVIDNPFLDFNRSWIIHYDNPWTYS